MASGKGIRWPGTSPRESKLSQGGAVSTTASPTASLTCGPEISELVKILLQARGCLVFVRVGSGGIPLCPAGQETRLRLPQAGAIYTQAPGSLPREARPRSYRQGQGRWLQDGGTHPPCGSLGGTPSLTSAWKPSTRMATSRLKST